MNLNRSVFVSLVILAVLATAGCAVRYGPRIPGFQPGYTDQRLGETTYQIKFGEAWPKDWPDLEKFAMYRAAEITESSSKRYFQILNSSTQTSTYHIASPAISNTSATASRVGNTTFVNATTTTTPGSVSSFSGGWYILDFKVLSESEVSFSERVVDAQQVKRDLQYFINGRR